LEVRIDGLWAAGKEALQFTGEKHLHSRRSALHGDVFCVQIVFLKNILVIRSPQNGVNGGAETAAGDAEFFRGGSRPDLEQVNGQGNATGETGFIHRVSL